MSTVIDVTKDIQTMREIIEMIHDWEDLLGTEDQYYLDASTVFDHELLTELEEKTYTRTFDKALARINKRHDSETIYAVYNEQMFVINQQRLSVLF